MTPETETATEETTAVEVLSSNALMVQTRAEIDSQIATAKAYPRSLKKSLDGAEVLINSHPEVAESCFYSLPRGGKIIEGGSIRLAEIIAATWGNVRCTAEVIEIGDRFVKVQATCHDLESNTAFRVEAQRNIIYQKGTRKGKRYNDDMIQTTAQAAISVALRNAVFRVVPWALVKPLYDKAKIFAGLNPEAVLKKRTEIIGLFVELGISEERLLDHLGRERVVEITAEDMKKLRGYLNALTDEAITIEDLFGAEKGAQKGSPKDVDVLNKKLKAQAEGKTDEKPEEEAPETPQESGEADQDPSPPEQEELPEGDTEPEKKFEPLPPVDPEDIREKIIALFDECDPTWKDWLGIVKSAKLSGAGNKTALAYVRKLDEGSAEKVLVLLTEYAEAQSARSG